MKQDKDWIDVMRSSLRDAEPTPPAGGWERLERELGAAVPPRGSVWRIYWPRIAAVAAVLLCAVVGGELLLHKGRNVIPDGGVIVSEANNSGDAAGQIIPLSPVDPELEKQVKEANRRMIAELGERSAPDVPRDKTQKQLAQAVTGKSRDGSVRRSTAEEQRGAVLETDDGQSVRNVAGDHSGAAKSDRNMTGERPGAEKQDPNVAGEHSGAGEPDRTAPAAERSASLSDRTATSAEHAASVGDRASRTTDSRSATSQAADSRTKASQAADSRSAGSFGDDIFADASVPGKARRGGTSFSVFGGGGVSGGAESVRAISRTFADMDIGPGQVVVSQKITYGDFSYRHHLPLSFGVTLRKGFAHGLSLESGVNYTLLRSEVGGNDRNKEMSQKLHFIGIPLRMNWQFLERGRFSLYIGAGGMLEKCVSARFGDQQIDEKQLQWSVTGAAGAQYRLGGVVGLYFEPEASYYFTQTKLRTSRTESPLSLTLRLGVRLSF